MSEWSALFQERDRVRGVALIRDAEWVLRQWEAAVYVAERGGPCPLPVEVAKERAARARQVLADVKRVFGT